MTSRMDWNQILCSERPRRSSMPGELRTEFERDYDRTLFSNPVKRLQDKAQVFPLETNDAVRTRLTHSLEVSTVAFSLAAKICRAMKERGWIRDDQDRPIETIARTCGLLHDLGNPPFGHSGETAIQNWAARRPQLFPKEEFGDFYFFEGNAQTLRLVSKLQVLSDFNGLNLTFATLSALRKYVASADSVNPEIHSHSKLGYFSAEEPLIARIEEKTGVAGVRNPITFMVEAADDIVYSAADIEDAVKKRIVSWHSIETFLKGVSDESVQCALDRKNRILGGTSGASDAIHASAFRTTAIGVMIDSAAKEFLTRYDEIMEGVYSSELVKTASAAPLVGNLKKYAASHVYCTHENLKLELMGRKIISDLLDLFWEGAASFPREGWPSAKNFQGKIGLLFSDNYVKVFQHELKTSANERKNRLQLATDYICGMTDSFAKQLHQDLMNG